MRQIIFLLTISLFMMNCGQNETKQKELELKERELALKEKELSLKYTDSTHPKAIIIDTTKQITNLEPEQKLDLPFVGTKVFEMRPFFSGTGTPQKYIEIKNNGDVYFGFEQYNQAYEASEREKHVASDRYYAGKYKLFMKCVFGNEVTYYKITKEKISEVDNNNKILTDCCSDYNSYKECPCESELN